MIGYILLMLNINMHKYNESRYRARKKYYDKEENKEKKRIYMRAYAQRPYVIAKRRKYSFIYNASSEGKLKRHEWYIQKKIKDYENKTT